MKKIIYLFTVLLTVFAINSCDRMEDHDGNLLNDLDAQLLQEDNCQRLAAGTADYAEGVAAFIEKRKPVFTGS